MHKSLFISDNLTQHKVFGEHLGEIINTKTSLKGELIVNIETALRGENKHQDRIEGRKYNAISRAVSGDRKVLKSKVTNVF